MIRTLLCLIVFAQPLAAMDIVEVISPEGTRVWVVDAPEIPIVSLELSFEGGSRLDPDGREGLTTMMVGLLAEGAGERDALAFAEARQDLAARFGFRNDKDSVSVSASVLSETLDESVALLASAIARPRFDPPAVDRVRTQLLSAIDSDTRNPRALAGRALSETFFAGHVYARPSDGTRSSVSAITVDDLRLQHARTLVRGRVTAAVVGDIRPEEAGPLIDRLLAGLPEVGPPLPEPADVQEGGAPLIIPFDVPQSIAVFGHEGPARDDPAFLAAFVANTVIGGGGFGSRLAEDIREARGLTYSISTALSPRDQAALILGSVSSANDRIAEVVRLVEEEWTRAGQDGITADELDEAKRYLTGAYALRFTSNGAIAGSLVGLQRAGLPIDYPDRRNALVEALTLEEVNAAARALYRPDALRFVIVGQPEGLTRTE
ncbi:MAG: pitrilysin family protein [Pseudomonadota bacterium]